MPVVYQPGGGGGLVHIVGLCIVCLIVVHSQFNFRMLHKNICLMSKLKLKLNYLCVGELQRAMSDSETLRNSLHGFKQYWFQMMITFVLFSSICVHMQLHTLGEKQIDLVYSFLYLILVLRKHIVNFLEPHRDRVDLMSFSFHYKLRIWKRILEICISLLANLPDQSANF